MNPVRQGDGVGLSAAGFSEVREGDGTVLWSQGGAIPDSGVLRYNFEDDGDTTSITDSFNSNTGTNQGGDYVTTSEFGSLAISLSDGDWVQHPTVPIDPSNSWSVSMFANIDVLPSSEVARIWHPRAQYDASLEISDGSVGSKGEVSYFTYNTSAQDRVSSGTTLSTGTYTHIGVSNDGSGTYDIVVDGDIKSTASLPDPGVRNNSNAIGKNPAFDNYQFLGKVDRFDIYNKKLSASEWSNLATTGEI